MGLQLSKATPGKVFLIFDSDRKVWLVSTRLVPSAKWLQAMRKVNPKFQWKPEHLKAEEFGIEAEAFARYRELGGNS